jgi:hypothetical protein
MFKTFYFVFEPIKYTFTLQGVRENSKSGHKNSTDVKSLKSTGLNETADSLLWHFFKPYSYLQKSYF